MAEAKTKLEAVDDYVVFDLETTGRSFYYDKIIEIGALKVQGGEVVDSFQTFVNPEKKLPREIVDLTGINDDMLVDAPSCVRAVNDFFEFAGGAPFVGHNVMFDCNFIENAFDAAVIHNPAIDTMRISRLANSQGLICTCDNRLATVYEYCISHGGRTLSVEGDAHRALYDSGMTYSVYESLKGYVPTICVARSAKQGGGRPRLSENTLQLGTLLSMMKGMVGQGRLNIEECAYILEAIEDSKELRSDPALSRVYNVLVATFEDGLVEAHEAEAILAEFAGMADPVCHRPIDIVFDGKEFVITGGFEFGSDAEVLEAIEECGGSASKKSPTKKTSYVVVGNRGSSRWSFGNYGSKVEKAIGLKEKGQDIQIIDEDVLARCMREKLW